MSFGGTKNGCWCAEALIFFDLKLAEQMPYLQKRAGQLYSKSRFITAQFEAYFNNNLWVELATYANSMADQLRAGIAVSNRIRAAWKGEANEIFAIMQSDDAAKLQLAGAHFAEWQAPHNLAGSLSDNEKMYRFVTSFATTKEDVDQFLGELANL